MAQMDHVQISEKESQIIAENHLGSPLRVYPTNRFSIFLYYMVVILFQLLFLIALFILIDALIALIYVRLASEDIFVFVFVVFVSFFMLCFLQYYSAIYFLNRKNHLILCEEGLLRMSNKNFRTQIEVVRWQEITSVTRDIFLLQYNIIHRGNQRVFTIHIGYQSYKELIDLIKEKSKKKIT